MNRDETNKSEKKDSILTCNGTQTHIVGEEKSSAEGLSSTHDVNKVDSEAQLKELAQTLSAAIEIHLGRSELGNSYPKELTFSNDALKKIYSYRSEFETIFNKFLDPKNENQRWVINALHKNIIGDENIAIFQMTELPLSVEAIDLYVNHPIRSQLIRLAHVFVIPLFNNEVARSFDSDAFFGVWFNQILGLTCNIAAEFDDSRSSLCIDCLSKETFFKRIRKVVRNFVAEQTKRTRLSCNEPIATKKRLLKTLDLLIADITEGTFIELANEFGEFCGDYIEIRKPTETEIN